VIQDDETIVDSERYSSSVEITGDIVSGAPAGRQAPKASRPAAAASREALVVAVPFHCFARSQNCTDASRCTAIPGHECSLDRAHANC